MIAFVLAAQLAAAAPPRAAAGTYTYATSYQGVSVGRSTVTVDSGGTQISERVAGSYGATAANASATLALNPDLSPASYRATGTMGGNALNDAATVTNGIATVTSARGTNQSFRLTPPAAHFVVVDLGTLAGFVALPEQMKAWSDAPVLAVVPSFGQAIALTPGAATAASGGAVPPAGVPAADTALSFGGNVPFTMWYNPATLVPDAIVVPSQNISIKRV